MECMVYNFSLHSDNNNLVYVNKMPIMLAAYTSFLIQTSHKVRKPSNFYSLNRATNLTYALRECCVRNTYNLQHIAYVVISNSWAFCTEHAPNLARNPWGEGVKFNMAAYE